MDKSKIGWTTSTWNPVSGCTQISPGCDHCYAKSIAESPRFASVYPDGFDVTLRPQALETPLRWKTPRRVFVNSMSDLFHSLIPASYLDDIWRVMMEAPPAHLPGFDEAPPPGCSRDCRAGVAHPRLDLDWDVGGEPDLRGQPYPRAAQHPSPGPVGVLRTAAGAG